MMSLSAVPGSPDEWLAENIANLLYLCGDTITLNVLNSKAINGRVTELASIITSMCLVSTAYFRSTIITLNLIMFDIINCCFFNEQLFRLA